MDTSRAFSLRRASFLLYLPLPLEGPASARTLGRAPLRVRERRRTKDASCSRSQVRAMPAQVEIYNVMVRLSGGGGGGGGGGRERETRGAPTTGRTFWRRNGECEGDRAPALCQLADIFTSRVGRRRCSLYLPLSLSLYLSLPLSLPLSTSLYLSTPLYTSGLSNERENSSATTCRAAPTATTIRFSNVSCICLPTFDTRLEDRHVQRTHDHRTFSRYIFPFSFSLITYLRIASFSLLLSASPGLILYTRFGRVLSLSSRRYSVLKYERSAATSL
jgi:hypothetical protein